MKKVKLVIAAFAMLSLGSSSAVYADGFAPGEGMYLGAFVGHAAGHVSAKVKSDETGQSNVGGNNSETIIEFKDGGLALNGVEGGAWLGYGYKMGDLYAGIESDFAGGGGKFEISSSNTIMVTNNGVDAEILDKISAEMMWNGGIAGRIGYYVNPDTLLSFKGGISAAKFETTFAGISESFYGGGPRFGASLESRISAIDPNLSVRLTANYVDYLTARAASFGNNGVDSDGTTNVEISGAAYNARLGVQYSFFDVNSLF